jgi:tripartite-type tricarboxylate transporter receptor subunit TctC
VPFSSVCILGGIKSQASKVDAQLGQLSNILNAVKEMLDTHVINGAPYSLKCDVLKDFAPILPLVRSSPVLMGRKTMPARDVPELIALLKANPNKASVGIIPFPYQYDLAM